MIKAETDMEERKRLQEECRKRINRILLNMGKYDPQSIQYEILRREMVREIDLLDELDA